MLYYTALESSGRGGKGIPWNPVLCAGYSPPSRKTFFFQSTQGGQRKPSTPSVAAKDTPQGLGVPGGIPRDALWALGLFVRLIPRARATIPWKIHISGSFWGNQPYSRVVFPSLQATKKLRCRRRKLAVRHLHRAVEGEVEQTPKVVNHGPWTYRVARLRLVLFN